MGGLAGARRTLNNGQGVVNPIHTSCQQQPAFEPDYLPGLCCNRTSGASGYLSDLWGVLS